MFALGQPYNSVDLFSSLRMSESIMSTFFYYDVEVKERKANFGEKNHNKIKQNFFFFPPNGEKLLELRTCTEMRCLKVS